MALLTSAEGQELLRQIRVLPRGSERTEWEHGVDAVASLRNSITIRSLRSVP